MVGIVGLGNPGTQYTHTRHNIGVMVVAALAAKHHLALDREKFKSIFVKGLVGQQEAVLILPQTFMNLSGESVQAWSQFYRWTGAQVLVVHDELDLPLGKMKFAIGRGSAGHNGIKSITELLGTQDFYRLRLGIGRPTNGQDVADYVLNRFVATELTELQNVIDRACEALFCFLNQGVDAAMQQFHTS